MPAQTAPITATALAERTRFRYMPQLDGIRALAVALVLLHHGMSPLHNAGMVGVELFFVLSGYLITTILLEEWNRSSRIGFKSFYVRRFARLYPPMIVVVAVLFVPGVILAPLGRDYLWSNVLALTYLTPFSVAMDAGVAAGAWRHTWSLGIEELFYLVWPLMLVLLLKSGLSRKWIAVIALLIGCALLGTLIGTDAQLVPDFLRAGGMFLGCALALLLNTRRPAAGWQWAGFGGLGLLALVYFGSMPVTWQIVATDVAGVLLIVGMVAMGRGPLTRVFAWRPVVYFGQISYEVYLWHYPVMWIGNWALPGTYMIDISWWAIPLSIACAAASHKLTAPISARIKARFS